LKTDVSIDGDGRRVVGKVEVVTKSKYPMAFELM